MESGLLALAAATGSSCDPETIATVFRAAHSIKGSSATFGFEDIAEFTHLLETLLDLMREGRLQPEPASIDILLRSVDGLRELLTARSEKRTPDGGLIQQTSQELAAVLARMQKPAPVSTVKETCERPTSGFEISFAPHQHFFKSGNDPLLFLRHLADLGAVTNTVDISRVPALSALDTTDCFLSWKSLLSNTSARVTEVQEIFEWAEGECDLLVKNAIEKPALIETKFVKQEPPPASAPQTTAQPAREGGSSPTRDGTSIRVATDKVDAVINLVGELVITQSILSCIGENFEMSQLTQLRSGITLLARNTRELQETVLKMRMLPIGFLFDRYPRLVHDLSKRLNKLVHLRVTGEGTELDKAVLEKLGDPLVHLIRNSLDHGIELPEARRQRGKPEQGTLHLHAEHKGGNILIEISDDGGGLNTARILAKAKERGLVKADASLTEAEIHALIFAPGFSTADELTDLSGRGVGMDVVRRNIEELSGRINLSSSSAGTVITIELPLTLAILDGQLLRVGDQRFVVPLTSIVESLRINPSSLNTLPGGDELYRLRNQYLPIIPLWRVLGLTTGRRVAAQSLLMVVESRGERVALLVDELLAQQQVVIKSLAANFMRVKGMAGATILGDGAVAMILDVSELIELSRDPAFLRPVAELAPESELLVGAGQ